MRNEKGQLTIEMILLLTVLLGFFMSISNYFKSNHVLATVISGPWNYVDGMIETGIWQDMTKISNPPASTQSHPNYRSRHATAAQDNGFAVPITQQAFTGR